MSLFQESYVMTTTKTLENIIDKTNPLTILSNIKRAFPEVELQLNIKASVNTDRYGDPLFVEIFDAIKAAGPARALEAFKATNPGLDVHMYAGGCADADDEEQQLVRGLPPEDVDRVEHIIHNVENVWDK